MARSRRFERIFGPGLPIFAALSPLLQMKGADIPATSCRNNADIDSLKLLRPHNLQPQSELQGIAVHCKNFFLAAVTGHADRRPVDRIKRPKPVDGDVLALAGRQVEPAERVVDRGETCIQTLVKKRL